MARCRITAITGVCLALAAAAGCPPAHSETIRVSGTGGPLGSVRVLADAFARSYPEAKVIVHPGLGSTGAIKAVLDGALEIGISARPLRDEEARRGAAQVRYAVTPFFFATGRRTPVTGITLGEAVAIYDGAVDEWPDGTSVRLVLRPDLDSHNAILSAMSPEMGRAVKSALSRKGMMIARTDQDSADMIEKVPGALGTSTLTQVVTEKRAIRPLALGAVPPTLGNVANGTYPYYKTLYIVTGPGTSPAARRFVEFILSPAARKILERTGNLPADVVPGG